MQFREATVEDIPQLHTVRCAVVENRLSNPALITPADYEDFLTRRGKGWLSQTEHIVTGFGIISLSDNNVWALFVNPDEEGLGIGSQLHDLMLDWYFANTSETVWLSTATNTRAARFYELKGWRDCGPYSEIETKFTMDAEAWQRLRKAKSV